MGTSCLVCRQAFLLLCKSRALRSIHTFCRVCHRGSFLASKNHHICMWAPCILDTRTGIGCVWAEEPWEEIREGGARHQLYELRRWLREHQPE